jgi:hypothetical protein
MPIDASSDPYEVSRAGDPLGAKAGGDVLKGAAAQEEDEDDFDDGGSVGGKGGLGSALDERTDAEEEVDDPAGVATSKVDFTEIDEDLESAGTGARTADLDLQGIEKSSPGDALDDVDDLDAAGTGSGARAHSSATRSTTISTRATTRS